MSEPGDRVEAGDGVGAIDRIEPGRLERFGRRILRRVDVPGRDARRVATALVDADLRGQYSHGTGLLPGYIEAIRKGVVNPRARIRVIREGPGFTVLDGDRGLGQLGGSRAMHLAVRSARRTGIGMAVVRGTTHFGAAGYFARMAAAAECIGLATSTTWPTPMAPWEGRDPVLGNHPLAIAAPGGKRSPALDMALSAVARGRIVLAASEGRSIPDGWALDATGAPTGSAEAALAGTLRPAGGHKGAGLAYMMELLAGLLAGIEPAYAEKAGSSDAPDQREIGQATIAIHVPSFLPLATFREAVDAFSERLRCSRPVPGAAGIALPGDRAEERRADALARGIPLPSTVLSRLDQLAARLEVSPLRTDSGSS